MLNIGKNNKINRDKWLKQALLSIKEGETIIDVGAGELQYKIYCSHLKYTSQDFAQYDGQGDKRGFQTEKWDNSKIDIISDITNIPINDNSYDNALCVEVFEHIPRPELAIKELRRILKINGKLIITAPFCSLTHFAPYFFYTGFSEYWYKKILKENGFKIIEINKNGNYFEYIAQEIRRTFYIGEKYSNLNTLLKIVFSLPVIFMLIFLKILSKHNKGSQDVLCYGIHIIAQKQ